MSIYPDGPNKKGYEFLNRDIYENKQFDSAVIKVTETASNIVETIYPTTNALKAGQRFWYRGNEWHYMTQAQIDGRGWTGIVNVGFPAPISTIENFDILFGPNAERRWQGNMFIRYLRPGDTTIDFLGLGNPVVQMTFGFYGESAGDSTVIDVKNANMLTTLENIGTSYALQIGKSNMSAATIDDFFTQLPTTTKTATVNVLLNPGGATCDTSIATSKGYTVII